jgi:hypothetical protein
MRSVSSSGSASLVDLVLISSPRKLAAPPPQPAGATSTTALRIEPFDEPSLRAHLTAHGIEPGDVALRYGAEGNGPSLYIRDPDGNTVELKGPPTEPR